MIGGGVVVQLTFWMPTDRLAHVVDFLHMLDGLDVKYEAKMDSHPSAALLEQLPERIRILAAGPEPPPMPETATMADYAARGLCGVCGASFLEPDRLALCEHKVDAEKYARHA